MIQNFINQPIITLFFSFAFIGTGMHIIYKICKMEKEEKEAIKQRKIKEMLYNRNKFLVENMVSFLKETDQIYDFCEDRDIKFYDFEFAYFELQGYIDEDDIEIFEEE